MIAYHDIKDVHLEISTLCNASCPWCPRTFWGYPYNGGYPETSMTLEQSRYIFKPDFLKQLDSIRVNGNFGDIVMNPEGADIIEYFRKENRNLKINISTNGAARDQLFWQRLADAGTRVLFAIDGLEDTHHLYRQNTIWNTVIKNAQAFIRQGGYAIWKMIKFKHNLHQIDQAKSMSQELGFSEFSLIDEGRNTAPVFDRNGNLAHVIGDYRGETDFKKLIFKKKNDSILLEDIVSDRKVKNRIGCEVKRLKSIYIAANGDVSPCCYLGFYPKTYGKGQYHEAANLQIVPLIEKNNALKYDLSECIKWFADVEKSWSKRSYREGRLVICDDVCGS